MASQAFKNICTNTLMLHACGMRVALYRRMFILLSTPLLTPIHTLKRRVQAGIVAPGRAPAQPAAHSSININAAQLGCTAALTLRG